MIRTTVSFRSCRAAEVRNRNLRNLCNLRIYLSFTFVSSVSLWCNILGFDGSGDGFAPRLLQ
jgi:hypothetical protein